MTFSLTKYPLSPPSSSMAVKQGPCLPTLRKESRPLKPSVWGNFSASPTWCTRPMTGCWARSTPLRAHRNLFWKVSRDRNLYGSGMSHTTTTSPKPSFRASWRVDDTMVGRGNAGWTKSKSGHPCHARTADEGLLQKRLEEDLCWIVSHIPPTTQSVSWLNWTELFILLHLLQSYLPSPLYSSHFSNSPFFFL